MFNFKQNYGYVLANNLGATATLPSRKARL